MGKFRVENFDTTQAVGFYASTARLDCHVQDDGLVTFDLGECCPPEVALEWAGLAMASEELFAAVKAALECFQTYAEHMPSHMHGRSVEQIIKSLERAVNTASGEGA